MKIGRNDPCWCNSGLKYKKCHQPVDNAPSESRVRVAQHFYDVKWQKNAAHLVSQGCYKWMASLLEPFAPKRILDIGCGDGSGLLAQLNTLGSDLSIFSLEENGECIDTAHSKLQSNGFDARAIHRFVVEPVARKEHLLHIQTGKLSAPSEILLIEADVLLDDSEMEDFLHNLSPFDAVTAWLIGTHDARLECKNIAGLEIQSTHEYRLRVENRVYVLADRVLRSGGILHVVGRGEFPSTEELKRDFEDSHREQASVTSLQVQFFEYIPYTEMGRGSGIPMIMTPGTSGRIPDASNLALHSFVSIKP